MSSAIWKLENDLCRCCHAEGSFKNLAEPFISLGQEEVYSDMLQECLNIDLTPVPGQLCAVSYAICEVCISRVRDAANFKKQVLDCEQRFQDMYSKNVIKCAEPKYVTDIKVEIADDVESEDADFKEDFSHLEGDDSFDATFNDDDDSKTDTEEEGPKKKVKKLKPKLKSKPKKPAKAAKSLKSVKATTVKKESDDAAKPSEGDKKGKQPEATPYAAFYTLSEAGSGTKGYACNTCARVYKTRDYFVQHYRHVHLKERPKLRSCFLCAVKVPGYSRASHLESAHGIPAPKCDACGKKFAYPFQVLCHQRIVHMMERRFACGVCDKKFSSRAGLTMHEAVHSADRKHSCDYCKKTFKRMSHLRTHVMIHLDERRHMCSVCNEAFVQQSSLSYHITKKHPDLV